MVKCYKDEAESHVGIVECHAGVNECRAYRVECHLAVVYCSVVLYGVAQWIGSYPSDFGGRVGLVGFGVVDAEVGGSEGRDSRRNVSGQTEWTSSILQEEVGDDGSENDDDDVPR